MKDIEPRYNSAVDALRGGHIDLDVAYVIAGFAAYVASCSPTAMRLHAEPLKHAVQATARILDAQGKFGPPPDVFDGRSLTELVESETIKVTIDKKYPQAIGISNILSLTSTFGKGLWEIVNNEHSSGNPFFTSDFPTACRATIKMRTARQTG